jgi:gamma-glutamyltranspeptidase
MGSPRLNSGLPMMAPSQQSYLGMVSAPHHLAAQAGRDVLRDGGSAIDAAVAAAAALAVVYPHMTGIGGDGFWLVAEPDGEVWAIDACGPAASSATDAYYSGDRIIPWRGPRAANTVAGTIAGWSAALSRSNSGLPLTRLLRDAIDYAELGVAVTAGGAEVAATKGHELRSIPGYAAVFEPDGRSLKVGERLYQPALARTLRRLTEAGLDDYYRGELAREIASDLAAVGSPVSREDLALYRASSVAPLSVALMGARLFNLPPPTQGVASLLILALFERLGVRRGEGFEHVHGLVEATKQAFLYRDAYVGDPRWMAVDAQSILDDAVGLDAMASRIDHARALAWPQPESAGDTTWFGTADSRGQVVSCIQSTYFEFGSGIVLPRSGITWQNRGSSFELHGTGARRLAPGRKPFHTLNPALARFSDGRVMAYGTMGGEGQPQTQAAIFTRYARFGQSLQQAISAPRWLLGRTWGEDSVTLKLENRFDPELYAALRAAGHDVELLGELSATMGHAGAVVRYPDGLIEGANDPRSDGLAAAW